MQLDIKEELLKVFTKAKSEYVSGQFISEQLGCSRAAVWKHIEELRKMGYEIDAVRKKGYRIINNTESYSFENILYGLETKYLGKNLHFYNQIESTQTLASRLALDGAVEGTIVVANEQTKGRGRLQRQWFSEKNQSVMFSMILRPKLSIQQTPQLTLVAAVALAQTLEKTNRVKPYIKWPNDLLLSNKKFAGILTELQGDADGVAAVIIGIGINCNHTTDDIPQDLQEIATSLRIESGDEWNRQELLQTFLVTFEKLYEKYISFGFLPIKVLWESYNNTLGKHIKASTTLETLVGKAIGLEDDGALLLEDDTGKIHRIYSADISIN